MKGITLGALLAAALLVFGCGADSAAQQQDRQVVTQDPEALFGTPKAGFSSVAIEVFDGTEIQNAYAVLETLGKRGVAITLSWDASNLDDPERWAFVHSARMAGVPVQPWLLVDEADGYWPGATNAAIFASAAREFSQLWIARGFGPTRFVVDMEIEFSRFQEFNRLTAAAVPDIFAIACWMWSGTDRARYAAATQIYADLVDDLHDDGWLVHLTTLPQILDDYADGDDGIRQAFGIPVDGIDWDTMSFQVYRTAFNAAVPIGNVTPFFVADYGKLAKRLFGAKAQLDIGLTGTGVDIGTGDGISPSYPNGQELARDVAAALGAGYNRSQINVFNLQGMLDKPPFSQWMVSPWPWIYLPDLGTPELHLISYMLDLLN